MKPNMVGRFVRLGLVSIVALGLVGAQVIAHAQDTLCFGLQSADCQLLSAGTKASILTLKSFYLDYDINFKVTGTPDGDSALTVHGTGPFDANGADLTGLNPAGGSQVLGKVTGLLGKIILGTTVDAATTTKGKTTNLHVELRVLNNMLYINETKLTQGKWKFRDLKMLAWMVAGMAGAGQLPGAVATQPAAAPSSADIMAQMQSLMKIDGLITAERGPDVTVGSDKIAAFIFHVDLQKLYSSPDLVAMIKTAQAKQPADKQKTDDEIKATITKLATANKDLKLSFTRFVGADDKLSHGFSLDLTGPADLSGLKDLAPASATSNSIAAAALSGPVGLDIHFKVLLSAIGQKANLTAPADALPFNFSGPRTPAGTAPAAS